MYKFQCIFEGAPPAGNPAVDPAGTQRASQPITKEIPNKSTLAPR